MDRVRVLANVLMGAVGMAAGVDADRAKSKLQKRANMPGARPLGAGGTPARGSATASV